MTGNRSLATQPDEGSDSGESMKVNIAEVDQIHSRKKTEKTGYSTGRKQEQKKSKIKEIFLKCRKQNTEREKVQNKSERKYQIKATGSDQEKEIIWQQ